MSTYTGTAQALPDKPHIFVIPPEEAGQRIDRWLAERLPQVSRTEVQRLIRAGEILVNGLPPKASYPLEANDEVVAKITTAPAESSVVAEPIDLTILYQDADIIIIDKPSGMVVHPAAGHQAGTLVNALLHHCPDIGQIGGERRPGIVHRLDKDTSGLIAVAKHERALRELQHQFKERTVRKEYLALVEGIPDPSSQTITASIGRHPVDRKRQAAFPSNMHSLGIHVREAITDVERAAVYSVPVNDSNASGNFSLVRAFPHTGRTHQIRVHLAWIKHPIVGDPLYGLKRARLRVSRLFLHAHRLEIRLPSTGVATEFVAPLPEELASLLREMEAATTAG
jgi:23S rRNA pseudouridine1911/1915/1917 synthase